VPASPRITKRLDPLLERWGERITSAVGTMWAAILFTALALISLPGAIASGNPVVIVAWIAQTFLQLVLLPIIMVGQDVQSRKTEKRDRETHAAVMAAHRETQEILREVHELTTRTSKR
jgi:hypothetical protein